MLRVDSGGGDALASDLMWREIQLLSKEKPVVASMSDVAASGGYYMSMASRGRARARAKREVRGVVASMCKHGCQRRLLHEHGKSGRGVCVRARAHACECMVGLGARVQWAREGRLNPLWAVGCGQVDRREVEDAEDHEKMCFCFPQAD